eukprot:NODE_746_length_4600_cov_0.209287.p4 type:complete len:181 gc:universal NODE_746_length_4600_cov_0.209287:2075-1533(-)
MSLPSDIVIAQLLSMIITSNKSSWGISNEVELLSPMLCSFTGFSFLPTVKLILTDDKLLRAELLLDFNVLLGLESWMYIKLFRLEFGLVNVLSLSIFIIFSDLVTAYVGETGLLNFDLVFSGELDALVDNSPKSGGLCIVAEAVRDLVLEDCIIKKRPLSVNETHLSFSIIPNDSLAVPM